MVIAGERLHPMPVVTGSLPEGGLVDYGHAHHVAEEVDHLLGAGQAAQIAMDDDAVEAEVYKNHQVDGLTTRQRKQLLLAESPRCWCVSPVGCHS
jgi:hypothetical protein